MDTGALALHLHRCQTQQANRSGQPPPFHARHRRDRRQSPAYPELVARWTCWTRRKSMSATLSLAMLHRLSNRRYSRWMRARWVMWKARLGSVNKTKVMAAIAGSVNCAPIAGKSCPASTRLDLDLRHFLSITSHGSSGCLSALTWAVASIWRVIAGNDEPTVTRSLDSSFTGAQFR